MPGDEFRCERCGRLAPREMLACPDRAGGGCPYALSRTRAATSGCLGVFFLLFGLAFAGGALLGLAAALRAGAAGNSIPGLVGLSAFIGVLAVVGFGVALAGAYVILGRRTTLYNSQSGATWLQYDMAGIPVATQHILALDTLTPPFDPSDFPDAPLSHAFLRPMSAFSKGTTAAGWEEAAFELFQAALVSLWAREIVAARRVIGRRWVLGRPVQRKPGRELVFVPGPAAGWLPVAGELERRIADAVERWPDNPAAVESPPGPPVYELVRAVYEKDRTTPSLWLIQLVQKDAASAGVWRQVPHDEEKPAGLLAKLARLIPRYEPAPEHVDALQETQRQTRSALERLERAQPELVDGLKREFLRGMRSRTE